MSAHAPQHAEHLFNCLPPGPERDSLDPRTPVAVQAQQQALAARLAQQRQQEEQGATTRSVHQGTIPTSRNLYDVLNAFLRLPTEHLPELGDDRRDWLSKHVSAELTRLDLARTVTRQTSNTWMRPPELDPLLAITDHYNLIIQNDVPIILALRSWSSEEIANYYRKHGISALAQATLADLLRSTENDNIPRHAITFLRQTGYHSPVIQISSLLLRETQQVRPCGRRRSSASRASPQPRCLPRTSKRSRHWR